MTTSQTTEHMKVRIELRDPSGQGPRGEWLWARPHEAHDGGGTYTLFNISHFGPLGLGDVVRAELDGDGLLQVVDVVAVADSVWSRFAWSRHLTDAEATAMGDSWCTRGSQWSEGNGQVLTTMWPGMTAAGVRRAVAPNLRDGRGYPDPEFLAFVQTMAGDEAEVTRALEAGQHRVVLRMLGEAE